MRKKEVNLMEKKTVSNTKKYMAKPGKKPYTHLKILLEK